MAKKMTLKKGPRQPINKTSRRWIGYTTYDCISLHDAALHVFQKSKEVGVDLPNIEDIEMTNYDGKNRFGFYADIPKYTESEFAEKTRVYLQEKKEHDLWCDKYKDEIRAELAWRNKEKVDNLQARINRLQGEIDNLNRKIDEI